MGKSRSEWQSEIDEVCFSASEAAKAYRRSVDEVNAALAEEVQASLAVESARAMVESAKASESPGELADAHRYLAEAQQRLQEARQRLQEAKARFKAAEQRVEQAKFHLSSTHSTTQSELSRVEGISTPHSSHGFSDYSHGAEQRREEETSAFRSFVAQIQDAIASLDSTVFRAGRPCFSQAEGMMSRIGQGTRGSYGGGGFGVIDFIKSMFSQITSPWHAGSPGLSTPASFRVSTSAVYPTFGIASQATAYPNFSTLHYSARLCSNDRVVLSYSGPYMLGFATPPTISCQLSSPVSGFDNAGFSSSVSVPCLSSYSSCGDAWDSGSSCSLGSSGSSGDCWGGYDSGGYDGGGYDSGWGGGDFGGGSSFGS